MEDFQDSPWACLAPLQDLTHLWCGGGAHSTLLGGMGPPNAPVEGLVLQMFEILLAMGSLLRVWGRMCGEATLDLAWLVVSAMEDGQMMVGTSHCCCREEDLHLTMGTNHLLVPETFGIVHVGV